MLNSADWLMIITPILVIVSLLLLNSDKLKDWKVIAGSVLLGISVFFGLLLIYNL